MKVIITIIIIIFLLGIIGSILYSTYFKGKLAKIKPYGEIINVFDGKMHIVKMGNGPKTIVLLPGMGTALPSADFGPLMRELSKNYTAVCIEYFGTGFSSETQRERTCENYVEEIRTSLNNADIKGPYVLMPHSISSVYSEFYASKYPSEVEAIISLDGTSTEYIGEAMPAFVKPLLNAAKIQQSLGLPSIAAILLKNKNKLMSYGYTEKEINDLCVYAGFSINNNTLSQIGNSAEFIKTVHNLDYPKGQVPYFKIISRDTYEAKDSQIKISPEEYQLQHLKRVGAESNYEILHGTHFIYLNNAEKIAGIAASFIKNYDSE